MPDVDQLPDSLKELVYRNGLNVDSGRDFDQHIERLIRDIESILARRGEEQAEAARRAEAERQSAEEVRQAEEEKQPAEPARRAEAARQVTEEKRRADAPRQAAEEVQVDRAQTSGIPSGDESTRARGSRTRIGRHPRLRRRWLAIAGSVLIAITVAGGGYWLYTEQQRAPATQKAAVEKQRAAVAQKAAAEEQRAAAAQKAAEEEQRAAGARKTAEEEQRAAGARKTAEEEQRAAAAQKAAAMPPSPDTSSTVSTGVAAYDRGDYFTALRTLQPSAQAGDGLAQYHLGVMYLNGYGVPKKPELALEWLSKAASAGVRDAQSYMGAFNRRGDLVPRNYEEAMRWYLRAAKQDYENSQYNIALMYYRGEGVKPDLRTAYMWAVIASMGGEPEPNRLRMKLEQSLSASDIAEGQREAALWRSENIIVK
jgi:TPR repeat protein